MPSLSDRFLHQIEASERRWKQAQSQRSRTMRAIVDVREGTAPDWRGIDQKARIARRLERLGQIDAAEAVIDEDVHGFNPLERILGASQLTGVDFFERGLIAARSVARIEIRDLGGTRRGYGSSVMISPRLLMTNNHVLATPEDAHHSIAQFDHLTSAGGIAMDAMAFSLRPDLFFVTDEALDFTIVAVEAQSASGDAIETRGWCPLIPGSGKAVKSERVNIIQHPGGERMQVTVRDNTIVAVVEDFLQYEADTRPGSSGSPVFNEQWELAALHHAGVPERDSAERILLTDGTPWSGRREDLDRISWIANEGTRISRIVAHVKTRSLTAAQDALWQQVFTAPPALNLWDMLRGGSQPAPAPETSSASGTPGPAPTPEQTTDGSASWLFRLSFGPVGTQTAPQPQPQITQPSAPPHAPIPTATATAAPKPDRARDLAERIFETFHHDGPYYDSCADTAARDAYWERLDRQAPAADLASALQRHLEDTHSGRHSYATARHKYLYPAIDLREDGKLQNVYSGTPLDPREAIARELAQVLPRAEAMGFETDGISIERLLDNDDLWESIEENSLGDESALPYNCEHVVCQSWFDKRQPMKADIHHLFACEPGCNSFRSNIPYWSFGPEDEAERDLCGRREGNKFEPEYGHGPVARATMYFLMRYPGEVGNDRQELTKSRVNVLLKWHEMDPVGTYERHRNWLTEQAQGNRNPFIDFPELASSALLTHGFGRW